MKSKNRSFEANLSEEFSRIEFEHKTEVRWWMASGMHTDETIREELNAMHAAGFCGVELCQLADRTVNEETYGYGSPQWEHDVKLILNTALDLGMSVSLTSGAGWSTANVPYLDPDAQEANQCVVLLTEELSGGASRQGPLPSDPRLRKKARFIGAVAVKKEGETVYYPDCFHDLTSLVCDGSLSWTAPRNENYTLMYYFMQGTAQAVKPATAPSYTINYFDKRGFDALRNYLQTNVLNDPALNEKIRKGNVQFFMDSLEYTEGQGITSWTENFREIFRQKKGYDILPYLFLAKGAPRHSIWAWSDNEDLLGSYTLTDLTLNKQILNDLYDLLTELYMEDFITPFRAWLHTRGIKLRVQISYGKNMEISEPIAVVDYPEAENRNQKNQVDMYRLWSGGAHLQNKILSSETGGLNDTGYFYTYQRHLQEAYSLYAAGYSRMIWHIWAAAYGPTPHWPGYEGGDGKQIFYKFGTREPSYSDYPAFNDHLGRVQKLLRTGKAGVDIGMLYTKYGQHLLYNDAVDPMHAHKPLFFPSTALQDAGYTYDYLAPDLLSAEGVFFDQNTKTLELAGYKALVLWQKELSVAGANKILSLAKEGLAVVIVEGAAELSPYKGDDAKTLASLLLELRGLNNVRTVSRGDDVADALRVLGIHPYLGFGEPNQQLLTQTRRDGNRRLLFVYNYCDGALHDEGCRPHGKEITAELMADGQFVPYRIHPWTGEVRKIADYTHKDGKTVFSLSLPYGDVALFALESSKDRPPCQQTAASAYEKNGTLFFETPAKEAPYPITDWDLTVESCLPSEETETRREVLYGITTEEYAKKTEKQILHTTLKALAPWDRLESVGNTVSGKGFYRATFRWKGISDGAYLDFGEITQSMKVYINGKKTENINLNRPKVDISALLQTGENTVEIEYSSNLNNLQLARGATKEGLLPSNFPGYETGYQSYGLRQAVIVPFARHACPEKS